MKVLTWDIETGAGVNGFKSDLAVVLCIGYKWLHESKPRCVSILDYGDLDKKKIQDWDKEMLEHWSEIVKDADVLVGHYSTVFDKKFVNGRLIFHGIPPLPPVKHIDTCIELRNIAKFSSNRLKHVAKLLKLPNQKKDNNWPEAWIEMTRNPAKHLKGMIPYCKSDVAATEDLYLRILPYMTKKGMPCLNERCPKCGADKLQKRGLHITTVGAFQRYQCQHCGAWSKSGKNLRNCLKSDIRDL